MFKMRTRGALKDLQVSASNKAILVGSPVSKPSQSSKLVTNSDKYFQSFKVKGPKGTEKENTKAKQAKRKNAKNEKGSGRISKPEIKSLKKVKEDVTDAVPKLNVSSVSSNFENIHVQSTYASDMEVSTKFHIGNVTVDQNVSDIIPVVTSDSHSYSYWQDLAEQRQVALEKTLLENEQLFDQVTVLQTENSLLKDALESAKELLTMEGLLK